MTGLLGILVILLVGAARSLSPGLQWTIQAAAVWLVLWGSTGTKLSQHRPDNSEIPFARLGPGNALSFLRGLLLAGVAGFLFQASPAGWRAWLPMACYTAADIADYFDGYLARRSRTQSAFGEAFDLELDSFGLLVAVSLAIGAGTLPVWFLPLGFARYLFALMIWIRRRLGLRVQPLPSSLARRPIAGLTMGFISVSLWPIIDRPEATLAGVMFGSAFAASFVRDGLAVSGVISPVSQTYQLWRARARRLLLAYLPLVLRTLVLIYSAIELPRQLNALGAPGMITPTTGLPGSSWLWVMSISTLVGAAAIGVGWAGRFAAFALLFAIGLPTALDQLTLSRAIGLVGAIGVLMLGTGLGSLWQPSDQIFRHRAGESEAEAAPTMG